MDTNTRLAVSLNSKELLIRKTTCSCKSPIGAMTAEYTDFYCIVQEPYFLLCKPSIDTVHFGLREMKIALRKLKHITNAFYIKNGTKNDLGVNRVLQ